MSLCKVLMRIYKRRNVVNVEAIQNAIKKEIQMKSAKKKANRAANQRTVAQSNGYNKSSKTRRFNYTATGRLEEWH